MLDGLRCLCGLPVVEGGSLESSWPNNVCAVCNQGEMEIPKTPLDTLRDTLSKSSSHAAKAAGRKATELLPPSIAPTHKGHDITTKRIPTLVKMATTQADLGGDSVEKRNPKTNIRNCISKDLTNPPTRLRQPLGSPSR